MTKVDHQHKCSCELFQPESTYTNSAGTFEVEEVTRSKDKTASKFRILFGKISKDNTSNRSF